MFAVEDDLVFAVDLFDGDIGENVILRRGGENLPGPRIELRDVVGAFLDLLDADTHAARDLGEASFPQVRHMVLDDFVFEAVPFAFAF